MLEVAGLAEETELITERMGNLNLLEKRAIVAKKKENARKELMKVKKKKKIGGHFKQIISLFGIICLKEIKVLPLNIICQLPYTSNL